MVETCPEGYGAAASHEKVPVDVSVVDWPRGALVPPDLHKHKSLSLSTLLKVERKKSTRAGLGKLDTENTNTGIFDVKAMFSCCFIIIIIGPSMR